MLHVRRRVLLATRDVISEAVTLLYPTTRASHLRCTQTDRLRET
jgi:hypothetical protein